MKRLLTILLFIGLALGSYAQSVSFAAKAPRVVSVGEQFQLKYESNVNPDEFYNPDIKNFDILAGPSTSQFRSTSIINGQVTTTSSVTYTYILEAVKEGKYTIPSASIKVDGRTYTSNSIAVEVVKGDAQQGAGSRGGSSSAMRESSGAKGGDIFLRMEVNKSSVYRGEFLIATLKLYSRVDIEGLGDPKFPSFNGFWNQVVEDNDLRLNFIREKFNNKVYETAVIRRYVLFPQQVGKLVIDPFKLTASVVERTAPQSAFDAFFGGGSAIVRKGLSSKPITVSVKELPSGAPASYNGAIGSFSISTSLSRAKLRANDAASLVVKISGSGNVKLLETPKIDFPADFEIFDPKVSDNVKTTADGATGKKTFEYSFIPRSEGQYTIPGLVFTYFDVNTNRYQTIKTQPLEVTVDKDPTGGAGNSLQGGSAKESIKLLGRDINYIKVGGASLKQKGAYFFNTAGYWLILLLIMVAAVGAYLFLSKRERENADVVFVKNKRANRIAHLRLKKAEMLVKSGDTHGFYEEMLKALWGYLSDKLAISVSELSKEKSAEMLTAKGAKPDDVAAFMQIIEECEYARYAPGGEVEEKKDRFNHAIELISKMEQLKK